MNSKEQDWAPQHWVENDTDGQLIIAVSHRSRQGFAVELGRHTKRR